MADPKNYISTLTHNGVTYTFEDTEAKESIAALADIASSGSWNDLSDTPTTLSGYGITDAYTKTEIDGKIASSFHYKGSVNTYDQLPTSGNVTGDVWNVATADTTHGIKAGDNVCWDGTNWDILAGVTDLSVYDNHIANTSNPHSVTKAQVGLGNVDNTSDENKPLSAAARAANEELSSDIETVDDKVDTHIADTTNPHNVTKAQVGLGNVDNTADLDKPISTATQTALDGKVSDVKVGTNSVVTNMVANLGTMAGENKNDYSTKAVADTLYADIAYENTVDTHIADTTNPHQVTKAQVGLGNVDNTSDANKPISTATQTALDDITEDLSDHIADTTNPHSVTKAQVGLGNVDNTSDANKPISTATQTALDDLSDDISDVASDLSDHIADTTNPHQVTKAQVGLGNVDNTSDADKPVSTAQQASLDTKVDKVTSTSSKNRFYVISPAGNQTTIDGEQSGQTAGTVAIRTNSGTIRTATPSDNNDATTKKYVDDADALKVDKVSTASRVYGTDANGDQTTYDYNALGKVDDVKVAGTSVVTNKIANLGSMASETASDYSTKAVADTLYAAKSLEGDVSDLDLALSQEVQRATDRETALNTKIEAETTRATGVEQTLDSTKADKATTYTKTEVDGMLSGAMHFKGAVATLADLNNIQNPSVGDLYNVSETGANYAWDGTQWIKMAENVDLSAYALTSYVNSQDQAEATARANADALKVDKVTTPSRVYGTDELGQPITYGVALFGNIDDVTVGGTSVVNNRVAPLGSMAGETATDYYKKTDLADIATSGSWNDLSDTPTTISGYGITDAYTKTEIDGMVASTFHYKGTKTTYSQLPSSGNVTGDVWNIEQADTSHGVKAGDNVCWNGTGWDVLAGVTDLSVYDAHIANTSNPHNVTKAQVGLGNVDNTSDLNKPISTATQSALDLKANVSALTSHTGNTSNPHNVTKAQVGLGNVDNTADLDKPISTATQAALDDLSDDISDVASDLSDHIADTTNPHNVTKAQVGLGNVDNTSDLNKPISTATQTALDGKVDKTTTANQIYGTAAANTQTTYTISKTASANSVAQRDTNGVLNVGTPTANTNATTKKYVDDADALKVDKVTTASKVYGTDANGNQTTYNVSDVTNTVTDVKVGTTSVVTNKIANLGTMAGETAANYSTKAVADTLYAAKSLETTVSTHLSASNPHNITKTTVGLGNVDNTSDMNKPVSTAQQTAIDAKVDKVSTLNRVYGTDGEGNQTTYSKDSFGKVDDVKVGTTSVVTNKIANLGTMAGETAANYSTKAVADTLYAAKSLETTVSNHISNKQNPHEVTATQIGLGNVDNTSDADKPISTATQAALDLKANASALTSHTGNTSNPHSVTASQVGLGNVDNTSDMNKPVSTAQQTAIDNVEAKILDFYGTCTTAAGTQTKVVTCSGFTLKTGVSIRVKFTNNQTYNGQPILNVNSTGPVNVTYKGTTAAGRYWWQAGEVVAFTYDGENWIMEDSAIASTSYYGLTVLQTSATSTKTDRSLTPVSLNNTVLNMIEPYPVYSTTTAYAVGDRVRYNYNAWVCNTAIAEGGEAWDETHWTKIDPIQTQLDLKVAQTANANKVYGTDSNGVQTLYDAGSFGQVDDVKVNGSSVVTNKVANITLGTMASETASDYSKKTVADTLYAAKSLETTVSNLSTTVGNKVDKVTTASKVYGTNSSGNQTTYDVDSFGKVDDVKVGTTSVVSNKIATLGTMAGETATNYYTKTVADSTFAAQSTTYTKSEVDDLIEDFASVIIRDWSV